MLETRSAPSLEEARTELANLWRQKNPKTPGQINDFYSFDASGDLMRRDLDLWHQDLERQRWTEIVVHIAKQIDAKTVLDIGAGAGHDLQALRDAGFENLHAVEPNEVLADTNLSGLAKRHRQVGATCECSVDADLYICIDVLEHIPDPEKFLSKAFSTAKVGAYLIEATGTHDSGTPLHLKANRGWAPGRWLEQHGWWLQDKTGRLRIWRKNGDTGSETSTLLAAVSRAPTLLWTSNRTTGIGTQMWRMDVNIGDALLTRSRSVLAYHWWMHTGDDTFLMVDDDIDFSKHDADRAAELCRNGYDIVCGAYPVRDGSHMACRFLPGTENISFGPGQPPVEIMWGATGFMAVHRRVLDKLAETLPLVNSGEQWYYPYFQELFRHDDQIDGMLELSEDWGFCALARDAGFKVWLDPQAMLSHEGRTIPLTVTNMKEVQSAIAKA